MGTELWSTAVMREDDRFDFWSEVICDAVLNVDARRAGTGDFRAEITCNRMTMGNFARFRSQEHEILRSQRLLRSKPDESYLVSLQLSGNCNVAQGDHRFTLQPGDIGIVSAAKAMHLRFQGTVERAVAVLPRRTLESACGWLAPGRPFHLRRTQPVTRILAQLINEMAAPGANFLPGEETALNQSLLGLLGTSRLDTGRVTPADGGRARLFTYLDAHLADPDLSPVSAANALGMSERTLHALFAGTGTTCRRWIVDTRLTKAAAALRAEQWRSASISGIALAFGFNDFSHFSRRFKEKFGCTPSAYRSGMG